jgi:PEP-CTERM motif
MHRYVLGFLLIFGVVAVQTASADTLQNCGSCGGVVYTLTAAPDTFGLGAGWFDFTLKVDTTHIGVSTAQVLNAVALKDPGALGAKLISYSAGSWTMIQGGTNNGGTSGTGCVMNTNNGWDCAQATAVSGTNTAKGVPTGASDIYTFVFAFLLPSNSSGDLASGVGLKAYYDTTSGTYGGLQTSDTFASPVPEPGSLSLLAAGLAVAGLMLLKRR